MLFAWGTWNINKELMENLRKDKSKEAKHLFRQLDNREFFSNFLSFTFSLSVLATIGLIVLLCTSYHADVLGYVLMAVGVLVSIAAAVLSFIGSYKLKNSAIVLLTKYIKQKQEEEKNRIIMEHFYRALRGESGKEDSSKTNKASKK